MLSENIILPLSECKKDLSFLDENNYIYMHDRVCLSGKYNFEGCRFPLNTNLNIDYFRFMLDGYSDFEICDFLEFGFPIGYFGKVQQQEFTSLQFVKNHKGAKDFPSEIQKYLNKELQNGTILGPFDHNPFICNVCISPLNSVPKKDTEERRIILDLSYPKGNAINDYISKEYYLGNQIRLVYPGVDSLVEIIKIKGRGCLLFKRDLRKAFRQFPVDVGEASLLGYSFNGKVYFDKVLSMGCRSSAYICQRITSCIKYICGILDISIENYLDDLAGAETPEKAWHAYEELQQVLKFSGIKESVNKCLDPSTEMPFLGVLFNTVDMTLKVTPDRLVEILTLVQEWLVKDQATLKQLQSLLGKLNFVAHCVKPARIFICRLLNWLRSIHETIEPQPISYETKKDLLWWSKFLPLYNGVSMMDLHEWGQPDAVLASDACLEGCGSWFNGKFFHTTFPQFIVDMKLHINALELITIVVAVKLWGAFLKGTKLVVNTDSSVSCQVLNSGFSRDHFLQSCLREICFYAALHEFQIKANFIQGVSNSTGWERSVHSTLCPICIVE